MTLAIYAKETVGITRGRDKGRVDDDDKRDDDDVMVVCGGGGEAER